jgi:hypothetical protein
VDDIVREIKLKDLVEPLAMFGVLNWHHHFDSTLKIARHEIGRSYEI